MIETSDFYKDIRRMTNRFSDIQNIMLILLDDLKKDNDDHYNKLLEKRFDSAQNNIDRILDVIVGRIEDLLAAIEKDSSN